MGAWKGCIGSLVSEGQGVGMKAKDISEQGSMPEPLPTPSDPVNYLKAVLDDLLCRHGVNNDLK